MATSKTYLVDFDRAEPRPQRLPAPHAAAELIRRTRPTSAAVAWLVVWVVVMGGLVASQMAFFHFVNALDAHGAPGWPNTGIAAVRAAPQPSLALHRSGRDERPPF